jgi:hypothetical protein
MRLSFFRRWKNRRKKHRFIRLATRSENFLLTIWSKKLLVITSSLVLITGYLLKNFAVGIPAELLESTQEKHLRAIQSLQDLSRWTETLNKLQAASTSLQDTFQFAEKELADAVKEVSLPNKRSTYIIDTKRIQIFLAKSQDTRYKLVTIIAAVKTATFQLPEFVDFYKGYEEDLRDIDKVVASFENIYRPILDGNFSQATDAAKHLIADRMKVQESVEVLLELARSSLERGNNIVRSLEIQASKRDFGEVALAVRTLTLLLLLTAAAFLIILTLKSRRSQPAPSLLLGGRPDLSRSQREKYRAMRVRQRQKGL